MASGDDPVSEIRLEVAYGVRCFSPDDGSCKESETLLTSVDVLVYYAKFSDLVTTQIISVYISYGKNAVLQPPSQRLPDQAV